MKYKQNLKNTKGKRFCFLMIAACFLLPESCHLAYGAQVHVLNDLKAIQIEISRQGLTRIRVEEDRIRNVFGSTGEYVLEADEEQGQIFIRPMGGGSFNPISLTLTTEKGRTQDLLLTPTDKTPEALILQSDSSLEQPQAAASLPSRGEIEELIYACRENRIPVGYKLMPLDLKTLGEPYRLIREIRNDPLRGTPLSGIHLRGLPLRGLTYEVRNDSTNLRGLSEEEFAKDSQIIAVLLTKHILNPGERTLVYVIAKTHP